MTDLDEALQVAKQDSAKANFFYDAFLNALVFIPVMRADKSPGTWTKISSTERFYPLYLRQGEMRTVPVFDELEKLKTWAEDKKFDYLVLQSHLFMKVIAPEVEIVLNIGTEWTYLFTAEILERLRAAMKPVELN